MSDRMKEFSDKWKAIMLDVNVGDMVKAEEAVREIYKLKNLDQPERVFILDSPVQGSIISYMLGEDSSLEDVEKVINSKDFDSVKDYDLSNCFMGQSEGYWLGYYDMLSVEGEDNLKGEKLFDLLITLSKNTSSVFTFSDCVILCKKAVRLMHKDGRLHSYQGPAIEYVDGVKIYVINGEYKSFEEWSVESAPYRSSVGSVLYGEE